MPLASPGPLFYAVLPRHHIYSKLSEVPPFVSRAIPWFIIMIAFEVMVSAIQGLGRQRYNVKETLCSLALGITQQIFGIPISIASNLAYVYTYEHLGVMTVPHDSLLCWWALVIGVDFGYYWLHRWCHEFHVGWIGHSVHHSGQFYNLATALRQGILQGLFSPLFYLPLALLGLPPPMFVAHKAFNLLYQYWIHTSLIGSLGPLEYVLNTPAHHRVHHRPGANVNYAGVLIIWDRMFGTFRDEGASGQVDRYGLGKQLNTFDPLSANWEHVRRTMPTLGLASCILPWRRRLQPSWTLRLSALAQPLPSTRAGLWPTANWGLPVQESLKYMGSVPPPSRRSRAFLEVSYLVLHTAGVLVGYLALEGLAREPRGGFRPSTYALAAWLLLSLGSLGRLADGHPSARVLEWFRLALAAPTLLMLGISRPMVLAINAGCLGLWALLDRDWWWLGVGGTGESIGCDVSRPERVGAKRQTAKPSGGSTEDLQPAAVSTAQSQERSRHATPTTRRRTRSPSAKRVVALSPPA